MGLLDKASDVGSKAAKKPVAKAVPKAKAVAKAVPKAKAASPAPVQIAEPVVAKAVKARPQGLPENFEIASANARRIAWFTNFVVNLGPIFMFLFHFPFLGFICF